jgi:hypothetical protein
MSSFPYVGFPAYERMDASSFHGRAGELALLADTYTEETEERGKLLVVYGPGGVGKTSFVQAGLWPLARRSRDVARFLRFAPAADETLATFVRRVRNEVGRFASDPARRPMVFVDELDRVMGPILGGEPDPERQAALSGLLAILSQAALRGIARVVLALREPWSRTLEQSPGNDQFAVHRTVFFRLDFLSPAGLDAVLRNPFARWLARHPAEGVTPTSLLEHYFTELTAHPASLPLFSALARRAHDLRALPPTLSILDFACDHAERLIADWDPATRERFPVFHELFRAAAVRHAPAGPSAAAWAILAADPDARDIALRLVDARLLTVRGPRWDTAELCLTHDAWLTDCPAVAARLRSPGNSG